MTLLNYLVLLITTLAFIFLLYIGITGEFNHTNVVPIVGITTILGLMYLFIIVPAISKSRESRGKPSSY